MKKIFLSLALIASFLCGNVAYALPMPETTDIETVASVDAAEDTVVIIIIIIVVER